MIKDCANDFNKKAIIIKTNIGFEFCNKYDSWVNLYHGLAIASVVNILENKYNHCIVPSTNDYNNLEPHGIHPLTNMHYGCDGIEFTLDGLDFSRMEKVEYIADNKTVQNKLRVCYSSNNEYNCSECEKCTRTMASFDAIGKLNNIKTFYKKIDYDYLSKIDLMSDYRKTMAIDTMKYALENDNQELVRALNKQISNYEINKVNNYIENNFNNYLVNESSKKMLEDIFKYKIRTQTKKSIKDIINTVFIKMFK